MMLRIFPKGANGKLLRKIMADWAELSIDKVPKRPNMSRERQKIILKREQETAVKKVLDGRNVIANLPTGFGKSKN